jgi:hypothetical protein
MDFNILPHGKGFKLYYGEDGEGEETYQFTREDLKKLKAEVDEVLKESEGKQ